MNFITYADYLNYLEHLKANNALNENEKEIYDLLKEKSRAQDNKEEVNHKHDKMFRNILSSKKEMSSFLNQFLNLHEKIEEKNLIQYRTDFITKEYKDRRSDIIYKLKNKPIYFLVEHQSKVDKDMPYRIFEYVGEIIRLEAISQKKYLKKDVYPVVIPIVIYTGFQEWKVETNFAQKQYQSKIYERYKINLEYNLVSIQNYTFEELWEKKTLFSSIMIIEKCKTAEELNERMNQIIEIIKDPKDKEKLLEIVVHVVASIVGQEIANQMIEKINGKEEGKMSPVQKMLFDLKEKYLRKGMKEGKKEGIMETAKSMLQFGEQDEKIIKYTGISKEKLENVKSMLLKS